MSKIDVVGGGYRIIADANKDLIALDSEGNEVARTKAVDVPPGKTSLNWIEVDEKPPEIEQTLTEDDLQKRHIEELKTELTVLEN